MGWDDNGLPTERRVQNYFGVRCDPSLPYDPNFTPPYEGGDNKSSKAADQIAISRRNFIELCEKLTHEDEQQFEALWRQLGLSVDWDQTYQTISKSAQKVSQQAFLNNLARGEAYQSMAPTLWDVTFRTAVAQAELEDREQPGAYHRIGFDGPEGKVFIETTRPELIPACVALVAHPDDDRYKPLFGKTVRTPLFDVEVPVVEERAFLIPVISIVPAPPLAITGTFTNRLISPVIERSKPALVPSASIEVNKISPAPRSTTSFAQSIAFIPVSTRPPLR